MLPGILVLGHGSRDAGWIANVDEAVGHAHFPGNVPVEVVFLEAGPGRSIQDGIDRLEARGVTDVLVIPLFVSSGSTHLDEIAYALGVKAEPLLETDMRPFRVRAKVHWGKPMDEEPDELAAIIREKCRSLSVQPQQEVLLLVGHGSIYPGFYELWAQGLERVASVIRKLGEFGAVDTALLLPEQVHDTILKWYNQTDYNVIVVPLFLSSGYFTSQVIPKRLKNAVCKYDGQALLPHPLISRWLERQVHRMMDTLGQ